MNLAALAIPLRSRGQRDTQGHAAGDQLLRWAVQTALLTMPMDARAARVGVSWGAITAPDDGADLAALIAVADERLYADKTRRRTGRGILTG